MRVRNLLPLIVLCGVSTPGCAGTHVPEAWRQPAHVAQRSPRGGWIRIETTEESRPSGDSRPVEGELIAVEKDSLQVLTTTGLQSVPLAAARHIRLVGYETSAAQLTAWAILGGLSTPTHGWYLLFTAPAWAIGGVIAVRTEARAPVFHEAMTRFARLPQGLPKDFDPRSLAPLDAAGVWHAPAATP